VAPAGSACLRRIRGAGQPKNPAAQSITPSTAIDATSVTTEFNTLFETLTSIAEKGPGRKPGCCQLRTRFTARRRLRVGPPSR